MRRRISEKVLLLLIFTGLFVGCSTNEASQQKSGSSQSPKFKILATTSMIADAARRIAGDDVEIQWLMGAGVDPHLYQPTPQDRIKLQSADVVFYHGLHLEGNMVQVFESMAEQGRNAVSVSRDIPVSQLLSWEKGMHDPHVWHDVQLWKRCVQTIAQTLIEQNSAAATVYQARADEYLQELDDLHAYCLRRVGIIPESQRWLITSHDAFHYYGRAYGLKVVGIQGISTETEAGLKAITDAVDLIKKHKLNTIFPETSVSPAAIRRVADDSGVHLGPELYSDALGAVDSDAGTYVGMIKANTDNIVDGLKGSPAGEI